MRSEEELLAATSADPDAFGELFCRHGRSLTGYFLRRTRDPELAADLTAETFAAALTGRHRYRPERGPFVGWLYGIARRQLSDLGERGRVEDRARRRLGMPRIELDDAALEEIERTGEPSRVVEALDRLPADQRAAVAARVVEERDYTEIAHASRTNEAVIRKRVSRGLTGLRARIGERP